jgi:hypothetical protein
MDMTVTSGASQMLIDARLDAIDRALLGRVSRPERLNVVGEVEARIHELLADRCGPGVEPARDDVLAVLARLDPPEAYLPEGFEPDDEPRAISRPARPRPASAPAAAPGLDPVRIARYGGVLGLASLATVLLIPISYFLSILIQNDIPLILVLFGGGTLMILGGGAGVVLSLVSRLASGWAVAGLVSGALAMLLGLGYFGLLLVNVS